MNKLKFPSKGYAGNRLQNEVRRGMGGMPNVVKPVNNMNSVDDLRKFVAEQLWAQGFLIQAAIGQSVLQLQLKRPALILLGLGVTTRTGVIDAVGAPITSLLTFTVNSEVVIQDVHAAALMLNGNSQFWPFPRPLPGVQQIELTINATAAEVFNLAIYCQ